jgi:hypothetical protein
MSRRNETDEPKQAENSKLLGDFFHYFFYLAKLVACERNLTTKEIIYDIATTNKKDVWLFSKIQ